MLKNFTEKKKYGWSPDDTIENEHSPQKMWDTPQSNSDGDESAYFSTSFKSYMGDETDGTSCGEELLDIDDQNETMEITTECLQMNYKYLKSEMEPLEILDHLHKVDLFSEAFLETCRETQERRRRNDLLIKKVIDIAENATSRVLQHFVDSLNETGQKHIARHLIEQTRQSGSERHTLGLTTRKKYLGFLTRMRQRIIDDIEPREFIDDLLVSKTISFHDHEDITRLVYRKDRVDFILEKAGKGNNNAMKITRAIIKTYPKLREEYTQGTRRGNLLGTAVNIRLQLKSTRYEGKENTDRLRQMESRAVKRFNKSQRQGTAIMEDLVEECRCKFEGLKISSVVIQLLTTAGDSLEKVLSKIRSGKAIDWLLSILDEADKRYLKRKGTTRLLVTVAVDDEGNFNNLQPVEDCLCRVDNCTIIQNKEILAHFLTSSDVDTLMQQMRCFGLRISTLMKGIPETKRGSAFLEFFTNENIPRICFCLLEEHIKSKDSAFFSSLFTNGLCKDDMLSKSHVKQHEHFLTEELEVGTYLQVIRSRRDEKSIQLLEVLEKSQCRNSRVAEFLKFILNEEDLTWFWEEVKKKQKYIWDSVMSSQRNITQCKKECLAVRLMNDTIVEEIDPIRLKCYMDTDTVDKLGFSEFEKLQSRRSQVQYLMNRLSTDTIGVFMVALRRSGYTNIESLIKTGSLAQGYVCPRIQLVNTCTKSEDKSVFKGHFDIARKLRLLEFGNKEKTVTSAVWNYLSMSPPVVNYFLHPSSCEDGDKSPASTGSARDSESGIFSGSESPSENVADICDFDDEGIALHTCKGSADTNTRQQLYKTILDSYSAVLKETDERRIKQSDADVPETKIAWLPDKSRKPKEKYQNIEESHHNRYNINGLPAVLKDTEKRRVKTSDDDMTETKIAWLSDKRGKPKQKCPTEEESHHNRYNINGLPAVLKDTEKRRVKTSDDDMTETKIAWLSDKRGKPKQKCPTEEVTKHLQLPIRPRTVDRPRQRRLLLQKNDDDIFKPAYMSKEKHENPKKTSNEIKHEFSLNFQIEVPEETEISAEYQKESASKRVAYKPAGSRATERSQKHFRDISHFLKSRSEAALAEYFDSRCSVETAPEERSVSSPPGNRDRLNDYNDTKYNPL